MQGRSSRYRQNYEISKKLKRFGTDWYRAHEPVDSMQALSRRMPRRA